MAYWLHCTLSPTEELRQGVPHLSSLPPPHMLGNARKCVLPPYVKLFGYFSALYLNLHTVCFIADTWDCVDRKRMYEMYIRILTAFKDSLSVYLINVCYLCSLSMENKANDLKCPCLYFLISAMFSCQGYLLDCSILLISYLLCLIK